MKHSWSNSAPVQNRTPKQKLLLKNKGPIQPKTTNCTVVNQAAKYKFILYLLCKIREYLILINFILTFLYELMLHKCCIKKILHKWLSKKCWIITFNYGNDKLIHICCGHIFMIYIILFLV